MIVAKIDTGYICKQGELVFTIPQKSVYETAKADVNAIQAPTDEELIELGRKHHPFFTKATQIVNLDATIKEIDDFEAAQEAIKGVGDIK